MEKIYLDHNATTPLAPEVKEEIIKQLNNFGNPASAHSFGQKSEAILNDSREQIALFLGATPEEITFTSGGTESNNSFINTVLNLHLEGKKVRLITTPIEHSSIAEGAQLLKKRGVEVIILTVDSLGFINLDELKNTVKENDFVSIIFANNEIGTVQEVEKISQIVKERGALLHFDGTQAFGKIEFSLKTLKADYLTISAHKIYGPKGIGALFVRKTAPFFPLIIGGGQEDDKRAGTQNSPLAAAFAKAVVLRKSCLKTESERLFLLKKWLISSLKKIDGVSFNGDLSKKSLSGTVNFTVTDIENELLLLYLDMAGVAVSTGSACSAQSFKPSSVLTALGLSEAQAYRTIRISMGATTTKEEIEKTAEEIKSIIERVRERRR